MCIEYNECHYGDMYNINIKRIFVITEIVHMNAGVSSEKEKVKESQTVTKLDIHSGCRVGGVTAPACAIAVAAIPTTSGNACWSNIGGAWLAPRGRPLRPRPRLAIYTCQMAS